MMKLIKNKFMSPKTLPTNAKVGYYDEKNDQYFEKPPTNTPRSENYSL